MEGLNKIKISFELDESILNGTGLSDSKLYNHIALHPAEYLKSKSAEVFSVEELDTIASDVCNFLLEKSDEELYKAITKLIKSSTGEFKGEFGKLLICAYIDNANENKIKELIYTFNSGVDIYKPILIDKIACNQDICVRIYNYTYQLKSDVESMLDYMRYILINRFDLLDKEKDKIVNIVNGDKTLYQDIVELIGGK